MKKKIITKILMIAAPFLMIIILILSVVSGAHAIKDKLSSFFNGGATSDGKTIADFGSEEEFLLDLLNHKKDTEEYLGTEFFKNAHMTKKDFKRLLECVIETNSSNEEVNQDVTYHYKAKVRNATVKKTERPVTMPDGTTELSLKLPTMEWGGWSKEKDIKATINISSSSIEGGYRVYWQDLFAMYQLVAKENMSEWILIPDTESEADVSTVEGTATEGTLDEADSSKANNEDTYMLSELMTEEEIQKVIECVGYTYMYYYDGARGDDNIEVDEFDSVCYYEADASMFNTSTHEESGTVKIPISVPVQIGNALESIVAVVDTDSHKLLGYKKCFNPEGMEHMMSDIVDDFQWDLFLQLLETLPGSESRVAYYTQIKEQVDNGVQKTEELLSVQDVLGSTCPNGVDVYIGTNCIVSTPGEDPSGKYNAKYGSWEFSGEGNPDMTLAMKDNITAEQLDKVIEMVIPAGKSSGLSGTGEAFIKVQEDYGVSAIGLLAIACHESGYGTSHLAVTKNNFFGWGAVDSNPYEGAWSFGANDAAVYTVCKLIAINYIYGKYKQDTYRKMRFNNGTHQYCTDTEWPNGCARIRAKLMKIASEEGYGNGSFDTYNTVIDIGDGSNYTKIDSLPTVSVSSMGNLVNEAMSYVGTAEYEMGGTGEIKIVNGKEVKEFDCSGLVYYLYQKHLCMTLQRCSSAQSAGGVTVDINNLQPGDLIFTSGGESSGVHHVEMYVGNGQVVSASGEESGIRCFSVSKVSKLVVCKRYVNIE